MTLQTHLTLEIIKNNKALTELGSMHFYGDKDHVKEYSEALDFGGRYDGDVRLTISDILDNAKELFGLTPGGKHYDDIAHQILTMCQEDKTLAEIEKYILKELRK
jgi:hypothetical protein